MEEKKINMKELRAILEEMTMEALADLSCQLAQNLGPSDTIKVTTETACFALMRTIEKPMPKEMLDCPDMLVESFTQMNCANLLAELSKRKRVHMTVLKVGEDGFPDLSDMTEDQALQLLQQAISEAEKKASQEIKGGGDKPH